MLFAAIPIAAVGTYVAVKQVKKHAQADHEQQTRDQLQRIDELRRRDQDKWERWERMNPRVSKHLEPRDRRLRLLSLGTSPVNLEFI